MAEYTMASTAEVDLHVRVWEAPASPVGLVLIAHGYGEHAGRYGHVAAALNQAGYLVVAPDHHGHGRSGGARAQVSFATAVADLDALLQEQAAIHPELPRFLIGHSMGGGIALRYAIAHGDRLNGLVLSSPLVRADTNPALALVGRILARVAPAAPVVKLDPHLVSRDPAVVSAYQADPLVHHRPIPARTGAQFVDHAATILDDARAIRTPTLLLWGTADGLCPPAGAEALSQALSGTELSTQAYPGLFHEIFNEPEGATVLTDVVSWLDAHCGTRS